MSRKVGSPDGGPDRAACAAAWTSAPPVVSLGDCHAVVVFAGLVLPDLKELRHVGCGSVQGLAGGGLHPRAAFDRDLADGDPVVVFLARVGAGAQELPHLIDRLVQNVQGSLLLCGDLGGRGDVRHAGAVVLFHGDRQLGAHELGYVVVGPGHSLCRSLPYPRPAAVEQVDRGLSALGGRDRRVGLRGGLSQQLLRL